MPNSLTYRLGPCQHLIITEQIEMCGRNCIVSKQAAGDRIRDLDRVFLCPLCPEFSRRPTTSSVDVKADGVEGEAEKSSNSDSELLKTIAINNSIGNLHLRHHQKNADVRTNQCKSVL